MLGFLIGTACLIGLVKTLRWGRHGYGGHGYGGGCGGGYGRRHWGGGHEQRGWGGGPSVMLRALFQRLDTTPGQEKAIAQAFDEMREAANAARGEVKKARADVANVMRAPAVDAVLFGEMFARHDTAIETLRKAGLGSLAKVHDALDERQRARLADLIESGPSFFRRGPWDAPSQHL